MEQVEHDIFLSENLKTGHICLFKSSIAVSVFFYQEEG